MEELKKLREEQKLLNIERIKRDEEVKVQRSSHLQNSTNFFASLSRKAEDFLLKILQDENWKNYLKCESLPRVNSPVEIREYLTRIKLLIQSHDENNLNWWLRCDDKSLLTQVPDTCDTRRSAIRESREPTASFYEKLLKSLFIIHDRLIEELRKKNDITENSHDELISVMMFKFE